jgi:hypothetical protein
MHSFLSAEGGRGDASHPHLGFVIVQLRAVLPDYPKSDVSRRLMFNQQGKYGCSTMCLARYVL